MIDDTNIRIAKRVSTYMLEVAEQQVDLSFFMGLGLTLAIIYEEMTGTTSANKKPQYLIEWAKNLPEVRFPHVSQ